MEGKDTKYFLFASSLSRCTVQQEGKMCLQLKYFWIRLTVCNMNRIADLKVVMKNILIF